MRAKWPDLKLYLREETSPQACESLSRGNLDCVLLALPYACGDVDSSVLFQDRLFVAVPGNHADGLGASIPAEAIEPDRLLMLERSEEHTSELQSLMRISYAVFCLKKKTTQTPVPYLEHSKH